jgi:hypothetical protein
MGYALGGGGRGGGLLWLLAATGVTALMAGHLTALPALLPLRAVTAPVHPAAGRARTVRLAYRDADGHWRVRLAQATGVWGTASPATWRQAMPGMRVRADGSTIDLTEATRPTADPYYLGLDRGRVAIWAGRPGGYHLRLSTTPLLAGALGSGEVARLSATVRVGSLSEAWQVLSGMGT